MIDVAEAKKIMDKYNGSFGRLHKEGTVRENKTVLKWVAEEANRKQRRLVGLDD